MKVNYMETGKPIRWVAIDEDTDEVIACGETLKEARAEAQKAGYNEPLLTTVWDGTDFYYRSIAIE